ncbi:MAG: hypothetical protein LUC37_07120, partial [Prevotella sp.]|nr:hypothetical protein [Prevotella sp.]
IIKVFPPRKNLFFGIKKLDSLILFNKLYRHALFFYDCFYVLSQNESYNGIKSLISNKED